MSFRILVVIVRRGPLGSHIALMSQGSRLFLCSLLLQLFILLLEKAHLFFVPPLIFHAFFTHLLYLCLKCLDYCDLLLAIRSWLTVFHVDTIVVSLELILKLTTIYLGPMVGTTILYRYR